MLKRWMAILVILLSANPVFSHTTSAQTSEQPPEISATAGVLMDMKTGQVLYAKNPHEHLYPASITKIMTAILALENSKLTDPVVTSQLAREQEGNRVYLEVGETQSMENMLYGLMLNSGNDAAVAIAEHVGGTVSKFADMMNAKAKEIGANDTHFVTPNGLHNDNHYTTAYDMALIGRYAMKNPTFREIVKTETRPWNGEKWKSVLYNINPMLYNYQGANGIKTGFTDQAMQTMVASAKRGDQEYIAVVMHTNLKQAIRLDATHLLDYGFARFQTRLVASKGDKVGQVTLGSNETSDVQLANDFYFTFDKEKPEAIDQKLELTPSNTLPLQPGSIVGKMNFIANGKVVGSVPVLNVSLIKKPLIPKVGSGFQWTWVTLPAILLGFVIIRRRAVRRRRQQQVWGSSQWFKGKDYY